MPTSSCSTGANRNPLVVIGLDGATFDLLDPWFNEGRLPHLDRLCRQGCRATLHSTRPPATLPAWTSFLTAAPPSYHGVADMFMHAPQSYQLQPASGGHRSIPTFLANLAQQGLSVGSLGVPGTYPPEPLCHDCLTISGFDAPGVTHVRRAAVWPPSLWPRLQHLGGWRYSTFNEFNPGRKHTAQAQEQRTAAAKQALLQDIARKERVVLALYQQQPWDVFFVHLQASDTAGHHFWHLHDAGSPRHIPSPHQHALRDIYIRLDRLIGRMLAVAPPNTQVLVVSDHGMGGASNEIVYLNRWLHQHNWLNFRNTPHTNSTGRATKATTKASTLLQNAVARLPPATISAAWRLLPDPVLRQALQLYRPSAVAFSDTVAFSDELDYAPSVWINDQARFPQGTVVPDAIEPWCDRIASALLNWRHPATGAPMVRNVHKRRDHATGPQAHRTPDLLIEPAWPQGYRPSFLRSQGPGPTIARRDPSDYGAPKGAGMPGTHHPEGICILSGPAIPRNAQLPDLNLPQAGALVYALTGQPLPQVAPAPQWPPQWQELIERASPTAEPHPETPTSDSNNVTPLPTPAQSPYTPAQEAELTARLAALGYLD